MQLSDKGAPFDTLSFAKKLQGGGFTGTQAETPAHAEYEFIEQNLSSKLDIKALELKIEELRAEYITVSFSLRSGTD